MCPASTAVGRLGVKCQGGEGEAAAAAFSLHLSLPLPGRAGALLLELSACSTAWGAKCQGSVAVLHAGLCCPRALYGLTMLSLPEPVINACCFPRDALCLRSTGPFSCILSLLSYLFLCHSASALFIKLSGQPVAAGGPALSTFSEMQRVCWICS